ncbi:MAG: phage tail protein I [Tepidanaerobacter acetatoxydans]|uniref:phage tail protein n=1 Tax=Tepidanaerobacter acetatoxydans TaxID=499229 RepID=UPI0026E9F275|nr:phage tail protein [Tepidanaerobacter acetatoxydans]NLU09452.1 phage tail protein I [Tepidanaerobacter acetatoxydans]
MIRIQEIKLIDILPEPLKKDKTIVAIAKVLQKYIDENYEYIKRLLILPNIDNITDEKLIDHLAYQFHVDFYDQYLDIDKKKKLVKNSIPHHRRKGTKWAIENLLTTLFDVSWLKEWFEYDGKPYMFKIHTRDLIDSEEKYTKIIDAINTVKNTRSWLEKIVIEHDRVMDFRIGVGSRKLKTMIFNPYKIEDITVSGRIYAGITYRQSKVMTIKPAIINESITVQGNINIAGANKRVSKKTITSEVK